MVFFGYDYFTLFGLRFSVFLTAFVLIFIWNCMLAFDVGWCWKYVGNDWRPVMACAPLSVVFLDYWQALIWHYGPAHDSIRSLHYYIGLTMFMASSTYPAFFVGKMIAGRHRRATETQA
jgi:hypothetical protein